MLNLAHVLRLKGRKMSFRRRDQFRCARLLFLFPLFPERTQDHIQFQIQFANMIAEISTQNPRTITQSVPAFSAINSRS